MITHQTHRQETADASLEKAFGPPSATSAKSAQSGSKAGSNAAVDAESITQHMSDCVTQGILSNRTLFVGTLPKTGIGKLNQKARRTVYGIS
jgi:hypothetical protein